MRPASMASMASATPPRFSRMVAIGMACSSSPIMMNSRELMRKSMDSKNESTVCTVFSCMASVLP